MTLNEQREFNSLNPGLTADKRRALYNIENWRYQLDQSGYTIPEVAPPDELDTFGLDRAGCTAVLQDYNRRRTEAIKIMPQSRVAELCRQFRLRFLGLLMPLNMKIG